MSETAVHRGGPHHGKAFAVGRDHTSPGSEIFVSEGNHVRHYYRTDGTRDTLGRLVFDYDGPRETPLPQLPVRAWFTYEGTRYELQRVVNSDEYGLTCPECGRRSFLTHEPEIHHTLSVDAAGALTAVPSVRCGEPGCGWHVLISAGTAVDA